MKYLIALLFPLTLFAEVVTTTNLISQDFTDGSWDNPVNSWHSPNDLAGWNGLTHSTSVVYENDALKSGFDMTAGAEIFHWYSNQTVHITQSVTLDDGSVISQTKSYLDSRGTVHDVANTIVIGSNTSANYELGMSILFEDTRGQIGHYSADVRDPYITLTYDNTPPVQLSDTQVTELKTVNETVYNVAEDIDSYEYIPEQEFKFEITEQPIIEMSMVEEFNFKPQAIEELNAGVVDVFQEIPYDNQTTFEEVATEIKVEEVFVERPRESFNETEEIFQTSDFIGEPEGEPIKEIISEPSSSLSSRPRENEESIAEEITTEAPVREATPEAVEQTETVNTTPEEETTVVAEEVDEVIGEGETGGSESGDGGTETVVAREDALESRDTEVEESRTEGSPRVNTQTITVESIEKKVNETLKRVDQRLMATSLIIAKAMESNISLDNYGQTNNNIFNNQLFIDGGSYDEQTQYIDLRNIYAENQTAYNDPMAKSQKILQESIDNRIRAEEHLRRIRGF